MVLGELVPKQVALGRAERLSLLVAWPMTLFLKVAKGPQKLLHHWSFFLARHLGARPTDSEGHAYSAEELKLLVTGSYRSGALPEYQQEMIHNVIDMAEISARKSWFRAPISYRSP